MERISVVREVLGALIAFVVTMAFFVALSLIGLAVVWVADEFL